VGSRHQKAARGGRIRQTRHGAGPCGRMPFGPTSDEDRVRTEFGDIQSGPS
jgi:hypothetical protein